MENGKITAAVSMESLDNCSTVSSNEPSSQVRTLFVSGLPMDTKPREIYLLFHAYKGYESSQLKVTNKNGKASSPVGFVTFHARQDAIDAQRKLNGVRFDPESPQTIRLELARSNTKVTKPSTKQPSPPIISPATLSKLFPPTATNLPVSHQIQAHEFSMLPDPLLGVSLSPFLLPNLPAGAAHLIPSQQMHLQNALTLLNAQQSMNMLNSQCTANLLNAAGAIPHQVSSSMGNPPCSTLFVALAGNDEESIKSIFKQQPGFSRIRAQKAGNVIFVEYQDIRTAAMTMNSLQGFTLPSSERGAGIRIEYAKTKMGDINNAS